MKEHKYTTTFSSVLKPLVSGEKDRYLAMASKINIGEFIPDIDTEKNIDLLPIAFNAAVVNRANKNGDTIDTSTCLDVYKSFINKPINIEHNRERVIGTILTAGFSEFGTDKVLPEEEVAGYTGPFNITLGGVIWRTINSELVDVIEDSADPTSENYLKVSASWELGFTDYKLAVVAGEEKNIIDAEFITDEAENFEILRDHLASLGGSGRLDDGRYVYRQVVGDVVPLGIGLTETPAADVVGVIVKNDTEENEDQPEKDLKNQRPSENREEDVASNNKQKTKRVTMKITSLKDINAETLQIVEASDIASFVEEELQKASEQYAAEKSALEDARKDAQDQIDALKTDAEAKNGELEKVQAELAELQTEKAAKEAEEKFNQRMTSMDEEYELSDEDRGVIASDVKELTDEDFDAYAKKMAVLLSNKNKKVIEKQTKEAEATQAKEETLKVEEPKKEEEVKASETEVSDVIEEALEEAEVEKDAIANSTTAEEPSVYNKYRSAFGLDQFKISV